MEPLLELIIYFSLASISGLAVGMEREHHSRAEMHTVVSGVRTFTLTSIVGFLISYYLMKNIIYVSLVVAFIIIIFLSVPLIKGSKTEPGLTTTVALVLILCVGMLFGLGLLVEAILIVTITLIVLAAKEETHRFARVLTQEELTSALRFITIAAVLIPLAHTIGDVHPLVGPGKVFDPVKALIVIVFVSTISFSSYLIIKLYGAKKGLEISAFLGGFVSSAATCASLSEKAEKNPSLIELASRGILLANLSMIIKCLIIIIPLANMDLLASLFLPVSILVVISIISLLIIKKPKVKTPDKGLKLGTPFSVVPAAKFGVLYLLISGISHYAMVYFGDLGIYSVSIGGLVSTTSVSASLGTLFSIGDIGVNTVISTLILALGFGSLSKLAISRSYSKNVFKRTMPYLVFLVVVTFIIFLYYL